MNISDRDRLALLGADAHETLEWYEACFIQHRLQPASVSTKAEHDCFGLIKHRYIPEFPNSFEQLVLQNRALRLIYC